MIKLRKSVSHSGGIDLQITELIQIELNIGDFSDTNPISEPDIDEPEFDISNLEIHMSSTIDILNPPLSPCVKLIITGSLPPGLIAIEELVSDEEEEPIVSTSEPTNISKLFFRFFHPGPWYFTPLNLLG